MSRGGDMVIPRLNEKAFLEKPPLFFWTAAAAMNVLGESAFTARLPAALAGIMGVLVVFLLRDNDEAMIRNELSSLAAVCSKLSDNSGELVIMGKANRLKTLFTQDCVISVGRPVPEMTGVDTLAAVFFQAMRTVSEMEVTFVDISVTVDDVRVSATTTMTARATEARGVGSSRELQAREIQMLWRKVDGTWKIAKATVVKILR